MANDSHTQQALADDAQFRLRVRSSLAQVAFEILEEDPATPAHAEREAAARNALTRLDGVVVQIVSWLVQRVNLLAAETTYNFPRRGVDTAATDAAIASQLKSDWNVIAGVAPPTP